MHPERRLLIDNRQVWQIHEKGNEKSNPSPTLRNQTKRLAIKDTAHMLLLWRGLFAVQGLRHELDLLVETRVNPLQRRHIEMRTRLFYSPPPSPRPPDQPLARHQQAGNGGLSSGSFCQSGPNSAYLTHEQWPVNLSNTGTKSTVWQPRLRKEQLS